MFTVSANMKTQDIWFLMLISAIWAQLRLVGVITYSGTLYNSVPYFSSHAHFSTAIDAWSLANSINPEHLSEDEMKS